MLTLATRDHISPHKLLFLFIGSISVFILFSLFFTGKVLAFSPNYNPNDLIDDPTFTNNNSMSEGAIQTFLSNIGSGLTNFKDTEACSSSISSYYPHCGQSVLAAQIIYDAAQAYQINPRVILATLEKEQSLVTDPSPSSTQLNCAMGYLSCSGDVGFFSQVDNGAWQLMLNYQRANGNSTWWNSAVVYRCGSASSGFYSNGLLPGNTVTFYDAGGTPETVNINNAATASLYCYTPYVGPYNVTGYSGSYNFVYYYQLWFGSTTASIPYAWSNESQGAYADSGYSQPFTGGIYVAPGQTAYLTVDARNIGYNSWVQSVVHLGTSNPMDRASVFSNGTWLSSNRIAMQQSNVDPGSDATFKFSVTAPATAGTYKEYFNVVADGVTWLNDPGMYFTINVVNPQSPTNTTNTGLTTGQVLHVGQNLLSPDTQTTMALQSNGSLAMYSDAAPVWSNGVNNSKASYVVLQTDGNLVEYDNSNNPLWGSGTTGYPNDYLVLQTDGNAVIYTQSGTAIWASSTASTPSYLDKVDQSIPSGGLLYTGQSLLSANQQYRLILQTDGNLVEYDNGQPLWASATAGQPSSFVAMQPDGNLVIYNNSGGAIWASHTSNNGGLSLILRSNGAIDLESSTASILWAGSRIYPGQTLNTNNYLLAMQTDGNLVIYNQSGRPVWGSGTAGKNVAFAIMQTDGNFVIYDTSGNALWSSGTATRGLSYMVLQSDGNAVIYDTSSATWASHTSQS